MVWLVKVLLFKLTKHTSFLPKRHMLRYSLAIQENSECPSIWGWCKEFTLKEFITISEIAKLRYVNCMHLFLCGLIFAWDSWIHCYFNSGMNIWTSSVSYVWIIRLKASWKFIFFALVDSESSCEETDSMKIAPILYNTVEIQCVRWRKVNAILKKAYSWKWCSTESNKRGKMVLQSH